MLYWMLQRIYNTFLFFSISHLFFSIVLDSSSISMSLFGRPILSGSVTPRTNESKTFQPYDRRGIRDPSEQGGKWWIFLFLGMTE
jgi:hypothetical protein